MARHREYYKGEGGGFPQVHVTVSFVNLCLLMVRHAPKVFQQCTNQLLWFMQAYVNN